jgi:hypothetical protein
MPWAFLLRKEYLSIRQSYPYIYLTDLVCVSAKPYTDDCQDTLHVHDTATRPRSQSLPLDEWPSYVLT